MNDYFDLGSYSHPISTSSVNAQTWFDRGLIWCYGFNHEEAIRCFKKVVGLDPQCAMGYWGIAYAASSFYNKPWEWFGEAERADRIKFCYDNVKKARQFSGTATPLEQQLIEALGQKHQNHTAENLTTLDQWEQVYAEAMGSVLENFPLDLDIICLTAESMMNLTRWKLWDIQRGIPAPDAYTQAAIEILERGLCLIAQQRLNPHPGILHFHVHALEMSPWPEKALKSANQLRDISPDNGHLLHMATHIDVLCGQYLEAVEANDRATRADLKYIDLRGKREFYMISCLHDFHSKMYAAMFLGRFEPAITAAQKIRSLVSDDLLQIDRRYLASTLEAYYSSKIHVLVRFGRWQAIVDEAFPDNQDLYPITTTLLYYGKTIAHAALGDIDSARRCKKKFDRLHTAIPDWHIMANNPSKDILAVAGAMSKGELEYHAGNHDLGYSHLRRACELSDNLAYSEPWPWMHPPRHALGALLLEQDHVEEAMQHYRDDLGIDSTLPRSLQHRGNIWALHGYVECLKRQGQTGAIDEFQQKLDKAMSHADISIDSSCCCRKNVFGSDT